MMRESSFFIGNVKMNMDFYTGQDIYSDGDIENEILDIVKKNQDYQNVLLNDSRWPILYHLTPNRRNLLEWYEFDPEGSLLEIGPGCGALTQLFCDKVDKVVGVELSKRRAEINATRNKDKHNLELIVGNLNDITIAQKFDYVSLIGVLEYAGKFTNSPNPFKDFLVKIKSMLKPGGTLILAIENKFGLKYWAGAREDHTGRLFESIEGYPLKNDIRTFSKHELASLLNESGFESLSFYYPLPDYKIPTCIFSDEFLPRTGEIINYYPNFDQERLCLFNEKLAYENLIKSNQFDFFANSFLIFCRPEEVK